MSEIVLKNEIGYYRVLIKNDEGSSRSEYLLPFLNYFLKFRTLFLPVVLGFPCAISIFGVK